ncbi:hypothetical protein [Janthinobacterium aquaticum]|uniref:hypothetical protein n=1 Tax=Janthinobacterium sp. FT58W TaxID=2654254 RepID=UPI001265A0EE|nr:hypothetical protein [Janthinobacterium sp. FT58W]KAB8042537.1 hypothetical protein GCM43_13510 [Janthinobacterium sp. FT58W]
MNWREKAVAGLGAECAGCLFESNSAATCRQAGEIAVSLGLPDCEARAPGGQAYIYVQDKSDPSQVDLIKELKSTESEI